MLGFGEHTHYLKQRIYGKINDQYGVATYRELPEYFWEDILESLKNMIVNVKDLKEIA